MEKFSILGWLKWDIMNEEYESLKIPGGVWGQGGTIGIPSPGIWSTQSCNSNFTAFVMSNHKEVNGIS